MDEREFVRTLIKEGPPAAVVVVNPDQSTAVVYRDDDRPALGSFEDPRHAMLTSLDWNRALDEIRLLQKWAGRLDISLGAVFSMFQQPPTPFTSDEILSTHRAAAAVFNALVHEHPGSMTEKFERMGSPPLLSYGFGLGGRPLTDQEHAMEVHWEKHGRPEDLEIVDGRLKPVIEPATGKKWACVKDLAAELGCAIGTLYNHMRRPHVQPTVRGRVFEYVPSDEPSPHNLLALSEAEKEQKRALARAAGFEPRF